MNKVASIAATIFLSGCATRSNTTREAVPFRLSAAPFDSMAILEACSELQWIGERRATELLMRMAVAEPWGGLQTMILCRLLFTGNLGNTLRKPLEGQPTLLGDTTAEDWPLEPVHIHKGVPFKIVWGYNLGGLAESAPEYLAYTIRNGVWNEKKFDLPPRAQLKAIAADFIQHGPWKRPLEAREIRFFQSQAEGAGENSQR